MTKEELLKRYADGERDFYGEVVDEVDLSKVNLSGANLSRADLIGANLSDADLSDAKLDGVIGYTG